MKRCIAILLAAVLCLLMAACSAGANDAPKKGADNFASAAGINKSDAAVNSSADKTALKKGLTAPGASEESTASSGMSGDTTYSSQSTADSYYQGSGSGGYMPEYHTCPICCGSGMIYSPIFDGNGIPIQEYIACGNCAGTGMVYY